MWVKRKIQSNLVDSKVVDRGFISLKGRTSSFGFLNADENPLERELDVPIFYLFKVNKGHPLRISSCGVNYIDIYPDKEFSNSKPRKPLEVYADRKSYNLTSFMFVPFELRNVWSSTMALEESFLSERVFGDMKGTLLYLSHGLDIRGSRDYLPEVSEILSSQIGNHFYEWLVRGNKIFSYDSKRENHVFEGRMDVGFPEARDLTKKVLDILEKRYRVRLNFD